MSSDSSTPRIFASRARLANPGGSLPAGVDLAVMIDTQSITLTGGEPASTWQIPYVALHGAKVNNIGEYLEVMGWVAGTHLVLTIPVVSLSGGGVADVISMVTPDAERDVSLHTATPRWSKRKKVGGLALLAVVVTALSAVTVGVWGNVKNTSTSTSSTQPQQDQAASKNLQFHDVPAGWGKDSPATSPLSGLMGTGGTSKPTPEQTKTYNQVVANFQSCMGVSNAKDRMFGKAGVAPTVQVPSAPYGTVIAGNLVEVGSVTQYYESPANVQADLAEIKNSKFASCFAQTMARFEITGADATQAGATIPVTVEKPRTELGVYIAGATASLQFPSTSGTVPIEIGTSILVSGHYEQTVYTFASPGTFPPATRTALQSLLAARLAGISKSSNT